MKKINAFPVWSNSTLSGEKHKPMAFHCNAAFELCYEQERRINLRCFLELLLSCLEGASALVSPITAHNTRRLHVVLVSKHRLHLQKPPGKQHVPG